MVISKKFKGCSYLLFGYADHEQWNNALICSHRIVTAMFLFTRWIKKKQSLYLIYCSIQSASSTSYVLEYGWNHIVVEHTGSQVIGAKLGFDFQYWLPTSSDTQSNCHASPALPPRVMIKLKLKVDIFLLKSNLLKKMDLSN